MTNRYRDPRKVAEEVINETVPVHFGSLRNRLSIALTHALIDRDTYWRGRMAKNGDGERPLPSKEG